MRLARSKSYLVNCVCLITINDANLESVGKVYDRTFFDINDILNGQGYFDTIAVIMRSKYDLLQRFHPFFGACRAVCLEIVDPLVCDDREVFDILALVFVLCKRRGYTITQIDVATREIEIRLISVI